MPFYRDCFQHLYAVERKRIVMPGKADTLLRLNRGEKPFAFPQHIRSDILAAWMRSVEFLQEYPSYAEFYESLSGAIGFPKEQIVAGAGIEEFIRTLMFLSCDPGQKAAVLWPTCAMYDIYAQVFGVDLIRIVTDPATELTVEGVLSHLSSDVRILFIPNPGQPVETYFTLEELRDIAKACARHNTVLAIDEAHYGFGAASALDLVCTENNVLILRTFSKMWGAAATRVGYAVGQHRVLYPLEAARPSGEIAGPSMAAIKILMEHREGVYAEARKVAAGRDWLRESIIQNLGLRAWGRKGFSVLVELQDKVRMEATVDRLAARGILVKGRFPSPVERHILVACGTEGMMQLFFEELRSAL